MNTVKHKICIESNTDTIISESSADLFAMGGVSVTHRQCSCTEYTTALLSSSGK